MRLPIVDSRTIPEELDYLRAWGVGPTSPGRGRRVGRPVGDGLRARGGPRDQAPHHVLLDAEFAGELASAARLLAGREDGVTTPPSSRDWGLVMELGWNGTPRWFTLDGEPAEDALRAVVRRMATLVDGDAEFHLREVRGR
jgi:hypothetical protein